MCATQLNFQVYDKMLTLFTVSAAVFRCTVTDEGEGASTWGMSACSIATTGVGLARVEDHNFCKKLYSKNGHEVLNLGKVL